MGRIVRKTPRRSASSGISGASECTINRFSDCLKLWGCRAHRNLRPNRRLTGQTSTDRHQFPKRCGSRSRGSSRRRLRELVARREDNLLHLGKGWIQLLVGAAHRFRFAWSSRASIRRPPSARAAVVSPRRLDGRRGTIRTRALGNHRQYLANVALGANDQCNRTLTSLLSAA